MLVTLTPLPLGCLQKVQEKQRVPEVRTAVLNKSLNTGSGQERTQLAEPGYTTEPSELVFPNNTSHYRN